MASIASDRHADCRRLVGCLLLLGGRVLHRPALLANARALHAPHARTWCDAFPRLARCFKARVALIE
eukprot:224184-Chlamydomonas_euryale.AAC.1